MDGWEKFCQHAVALALTLRQRHESGDELTTTNNPWVAEAGSDKVAKQRYQIDRRRGAWYVRSFDTGGGMRKRKAQASPAEQLIQSYLDLAVDEDEDTGALELDAGALSGLLYAAREANISLKGAGRLQFSPTPLVLRVEAEADDHRVELHAFLEHRESQRAFEVADGLTIGGAPTWFLWPETSEAFMVHDTPPWVLAAVADKPKITMDTRVDVEAMDALTEQLQSVGVPRQDLFALASDAREVDEIVATISGEGERIKVELAARYDNVTLPIEGKDPESARYAFTAGKETVAFYRDLDAEAAARAVLTELKLRWNTADVAFTARGDDAIKDGRRHPPAAGGLDQARAQPAQDPLGLPVVAGLREEPRRLRARGGGHRERGRRGRAALLPRSAALAARRPPLDHPVRRQRRQARPQDPQAPRRRRGRPCSSTRTAGRRAEHPRARAPVAPALRGPRRHGGQGRQEAHGEHGGRAREGPRARPRPSTPSSATTRSPASPGSGSCIKIR